MTGHLVDASALGWLGVRSRPGRSAMSALGVALGIATVLLVTGIPASGQADLDRRLSAMGADMLVAQVAALEGSTVAFPEEAAAMARRIGPVTFGSAVANLHSKVMRTPFADPNESAGISVLAATPDLVPAVRGEVATGTFLTEATRGLPAVVLGAAAARWLGLSTFDAAHPVQVFVAGERFTVVGVLAPMPLAPELEQAVFVGDEFARSHFGFDGRPTVVYLRAVESEISAVRDVLPATLAPSTPGLVSVSRPADVLAAKEATHGTFAALFLGLAGVALLVGGIGVANTMVVSVLERRREIGLRRALGARRHDVRLQFLIEAVLLSLLGGAGGTLVGMVGTVGYAALRGWPVVLPWATVAAGLAGAVVIGALAGLYPAVRASRTSPTEALAAV
ncbi:MAG: ABC transporter permease [Actinomycetales bacterium]|nr:ABC transporter permease [Actinomycetales bacterium]